DTKQADPVLRTFQAELGALGLTLNPEMVLIAGPNPEDGARAAAQLLSLRERPTAILTRTDALTWGASEAARRLVVRVREELSLVGHNDIPCSAWTNPPLTTVKVDCTELGRSAINVLIGLLSDSSQPAPTRVIPTELVVRQTTAACLD